MSIKEIIKHFRTQAQSRFNPSPDGSREAYYNGRKDAYNDCADVLERYLAKYPNGWHPASELPNMGEKVVTWVNHEDGAITVSRGVYVGWPEEIINKLRWCYPPKEE